MVKEYTIIDDGKNVAIVIDGELIEVRDKRTRIKKKIASALRKKYKVR